MKVLQINAVYGFGSTGVIVKDIEEEIINNGGEAFVAYQYASGMPTNGYRIGNAVDWKLHAFLSRFFGKQAYFSKRATKKLLKWIDGVAPDVVHLHNLHANYINLPMLLNYLAKNNIATVITLHDCWFFTGKCFHFVESSCDKWQEGCCNCPRKNADVKSWFLDTSKAVFADRKKLFAAINNLTVVGCSEWISSLAKKSGVFKDRRVVAIKNGIDLSLFRPTDNKFRVKYNLQDKFIVLGMANKWLHEDNYETVNNLLNTLSDDCAVVLVGGSADRNRTGFNGKVLSIEGVTDKNKLADIYSSADVFVNLTLADTLPTVNMESIACGTPVITYNTGGSVELVKQGKTGYVVDKFDYKQILSAIKSVKEDKGFKARCREVAVENFDKTVKYKEYVNLYDRVLDK